MKMTTNDIITPESLNKNTNNNNNNINEDESSSSSKINDILNNNELLLPNLASSPTTNIHNNCSSPNISNSPQNTNKLKRLFIKKNENLNQVLKKNDFITNNNKQDVLVNSNLTNKMIDLNMKDDGYVDEDYYEGCKNDDETNLNNSEVNNENEPIDPRIQIELERLNKSSSDVNRLENELEESKSLFVSTKNRQLQRIEYLQKKLGTCIIKSKPYYDALQAKEKLQKETQKAACEYQKAMSHLNAAKETLGVAEQTLSTNGISDVWQEYLSETITKINNYTAVSEQAEKHHKSKALEYQMCEKRLQFLEKDLKRNIEKSQSYYDEKSRWNVQMEAQKNRIYDLERALNEAKKMYSEAMNNLRHISEEIHLNRRTRKMRLKQRENAVLTSEITTLAKTRRSISKSLDNLVKTIDSTDDATSECTSYDAISNDSKKSTIEKRNLFAIDSKTKNDQYYSFNNNNNNNNGIATVTTNSDQSSRCSSSSINDINSLDDYMKESKSMCLINTRESNEDLDSKLSLTSFDTSLNDKLKKSLTANIIATNPKINESIKTKIESRLPATPPRLPQNRKISDTKQHETPLLTNLLLYNSVLTNATNSLLNTNNTNKNDLSKLRSNSFNVADHK